jgi:hypothetical protein
VAAKRKQTAAAPALFTAPASPLALAELGPEPADPVDRAWARVAAECPARASAADHRGGAHRVHVMPMGCPGDVRCFLGEPVPGYSVFYRPKGGHVDLVPTGAPEGTKAFYTRKTDRYDYAERAGR